MKKYNFLKVKAMTSILWIIVILLIVSACSKEPVIEGNGKIIILMYHSITEGEATDLYERSTSGFESDLSYLKRNNIKVIDFKELEVIVKKGAKPIENLAIITFDDGCRSWLTNAIPLLLKYNMKATFFLWVSEVGKGSFLSWDEVDLISHYTNKEGHRPFTFASHTLSHPFLLDKKSSFSNPAEYNAFLDRELSESKEIIEAVTPIRVEGLALPYGNGAGDPDIIAAARRKGYSFIRTSVWGAFNPTEVDLFILPSLPMLSTSYSEIIGEYLEME